MIYDVILTKNLLAQNGVTHESVPLASLDDQLESEPAAGSSQVAFL